MRILVIEDELPMRTALTDLLTANGYRVITAADGEAGLSHALEDKPDLVLLDVMMPKLDGFSVCREVRRRAPALPILMLTAKGQLDDRVTGLDCGADDYVVKPFAGRELLARIRAMLRRGGRSELANISFGEIAVDFEKHTCTREGRRVELSAKEFGVLKLLAACAGEPVSRERFLDVVWGYAAYPTTRTVDNVLLSLRQKLEREPAKPRHLLTVHGVGYRLEYGGDSAKHD